MNPRQARRLASLLVLTLIAACSGGPTVPPETSVPVPTAASEQDSVAPTPSPEAGSAGTAISEDQTGFVLRSAAFSDGREIPARYTCDGANESPPLEWSGIPAGAGALVLVVFDPDAGPDLGATTDLGFIHWLVYDLPTTATGVAEGGTGDAQALSGGVEAPNDFIAVTGSTFPGGTAIRGTGYDGPCPPARHTYVFRLTALDAPLGLPAGSPPAPVLRAMEGHVLAAADWTGMYSPSR